MIRLVTTALLIVALAASVAAQSKDLSDLAAAERAFAAETVKVGFRDGFIKYFADDGIGFGPHPERTREKLLKSPPATGPRSLIFNWAPMFGDISLAGDLGYTTGPVLFTDITANPKPPWHGIYFSVWEKQTDGEWKVVVDMGVDTPQAVAPIDTQFTPANRPNPISKTESRKLSGPDYLAIDAELSTEIATNGMAKAYAGFLSEEFRVHRDRSMPLTVKEQLAAFFDKDGRKLAYKTIGGKIADSQDLAFTYGSWSEVSKTDGKASAIKGYYVHVWRKDKQARWRLVADVMNGLERK